MLVDGIMMGTISVAGFGFVYSAFPDRVKEFILKHNLATEVFVAWGTYVVHAGTGTGIVAAGWAALLCSVWLRIQRNPEHKAIWDELVVVLGVAMKALAEKTAIGAKLLADAVRGMMDTTPEVREASKALD